MRPIKFRAWDNSEKEMVHWASLLYDPDNWLEELLEGAKDGDILMQFTGLLDKNGKEIYEGDIVKFGDAAYGIVNGEIKFDRCGFCILYRAEISDVFLSLKIYEVEVIGNIYENPELLSK